MEPDRECLARTVTPHPLKPNAEAADQKTCRRLENVLHVESSAGALQLTRRVVRIYAIMVKRSRNGPDFARPVDEREAELRVCLVDVRMYGRPPV